VRLPSGSDYGLSLDILTADVGGGQGFADRVPPVAHINDQTVNDEPHIPFGGVLTSGTGSTAPSPTSTHSPRPSGSPPVATYPVTHFKCYLSGSWDRRTVPSPLLPTGFAAPSPSSPMKRTGVGAR
jgi:hypothetical protein